MHEAAQSLLGEQDFSAFRAAECQAKSPIKQMHHAEVRRVGEMIVFEFRANAFLQHMVRNMVGALVHVGLGREPIDSITHLIACRDRTRAAPTFSPAGLYLTQVEYPAHWNIPAAQRIMPL
jgi:tRNA pseudouridine38-40 synthase